MNHSVAESDETMTAGADPRAVSPAGLKDSLVRSMMQRIGVSLEPEVFQYEVARAYEAIQAGTTPAGKIEPQLRACHSYPVFQQSLRNAGAPQKALILGCGEGIPGLDGTYAREESEKLWRHSHRTDTLRLSLPVLRDDSAWKPEEYDVVVTHSMVHFVYRLDLLFSRIRQVLRPGGVYVMGKEANARFFRQPELVQQARLLRKELSSRRRWKARLDPRTHYARIGKWLGIAPPISMTEGVNLLLRRRIGARGDLTGAEQSRLIELHRPLLPLSESQVGQQGLDMEFLSQTYLPDFDLEWFDSSGCLGYGPCREWPAKWKSRNDQLESRHKGNGVFFSALWRRER